MASAAVAPNITSHPEDHERETTCCADSAVTGPGGAAIENPSAAPLKKTWRGSGNHRGNDPCALKALVEARDWQGRKLREISHEEESVSSWHDYIFKSHGELSLKHDPR
jgi:hypothetical protein